MIVSPAGFFSVKCVPFRRLDLTLFRIRHTHQDQPDSSGSGITIRIMQTHVDRRIHRWRTDTIINEY